jgi:hypothetical protein
MNQIKNRELLRNAIKLMMGPDPHSGKSPCDDTVDAITDGVLARIAVNNARPAKYADEPWRNQSQWCHANHAFDHIKRAYYAIRPGVYNTPWLSDLGQPEAARAGLRIDFLLWAHQKGRP